MIKFDWGNSEKVTFYPKHLYGCFRRIPENCSFPPPLAPPPSHRYLTDEVRSDVTEVFKSARRLLRRIDESSSSSSSSWALPRSFQEFAGREIYGEMSSINLDKTEETLLRCGHLYAFRFVNSKWWNRWKLSEYVELFIIFLQFR